METKNFLNLLNNQYFKSVKRFENAYKKEGYYHWKLKYFNKEYLKVIGAVLSGDASGACIILGRSSFFHCATEKEKEKIKLALYSTLSK